MNIDTELSKIKREVEEKRLSRANGDGWVPAEKKNQGGSGVDPDNDPDINTPTADGRDSVKDDDTLSVLAALNDLLQQASALVEKAKTNRTGTTSPNDQKFEQFLVNMTPSERSRWLANPKNRKLVFQK